MGNSLVLASGAVIARWSLANRLSDGPITFGWSVTTRTLDDSAATDTDFPTAMGIRSGLGGATVGRTAAAFSSAIENSGVNKSGWAIVSCGLDWMSGVLWTGAKATGAPVAIVTRCNGSAGRTLSASWTTGRGPGAASRCAAPNADTKSREKRS
jgi:hypothetical protein